MHLRKLNNEWGYPGQPLVEYTKETNQYTIFGIVVDLCRNVDCRFPQLVLTIDKRIQVTP